MSFTGREIERNGRETNSKGQCLYSPTPCLRKIFFENVRKRDSKRKSGRGGEKVIMIMWSNRLAAYVSTIFLSFYVKQQTVAMCQSQISPQGQSLLYFPLMTETDRKVHRSWLNVSVFAPHVTHTNQDYRASFLGWCLSCLTVFFSTPPDLKTGGSATDWKYSNSYTLLVGNAYFKFNFPKKSTKLTFYLLQKVWNKGHGRIVSLLYSIVCVSRGCPLWKIQDNTLSYLKAFP